MAKPPLPHHVRQQYRMKRVIHQRELAYFVEAIREMLGLCPLPGHGDVGKCAPTDEERFGAITYPDNPWSRSGMTPRARVA